MTIMLAAEIPLVVIMLAAEIPLVVQFYTLWYLHFCQIIFSTTVHLM